MMNNISQNNISLVGSKKILITGSTGLLGSALTPYLKDRFQNVITSSRSKGADYLFDVSNRVLATESLKKINPDLIVNLVGLTSVEDCEAKPNNAFLLNTYTVENLAHWISRYKSECHLIHISTDHVYDGVGPHNEDSVNLTNMYAVTKYAAEIAARQVNSTILRTNFVGRSAVTGRESLSDWVFNSLKSSAKVEVLDDVLFSPLSMWTLIRMIEAVLIKRPIGVFNLGSHGGMSKADFDFFLADMIGMPTKYMTRINSNNAKFLKAYRPKDMRMNCINFENAMGVSLPNLSDEILKIASEYAYEA
jgi:dTDP-4-dehydrorhamnose reductase